MNTIHLLVFSSATDNASIEFGDDFGFDEMTSFFSDGKEFSPSQGIDI